MWCMPLTSLLSGALACHLAPYLCVGYGLQKYTAWLAQYLTMYAIVSVNKFGNERLAYISSNFIGDLQPMAEIFTQQLLLKR